MRKFSYIVLMLLALGGLAFAQELPRITAIEVSGVKRIEEGAVRSKITQKIGDTVSQEKTNEDIKNIFRLNYFEDVRVELEPFEGGVKLKYIVTEKPTIIRVDFQGNKEIDDTTLKENLTITPGSIADTGLIQDNAVLIAKYYEKEGYWLTNVVPVLNRKAAHEVALTYQITEGTKVKIKNIVFEGNKNVSSRTLKKAMETKEWWLFSFVTSGGYYQKDVLNRDVERIKDVYFSEGYVKVIITEPSVTVDDKKKAMTIRISISEGEKYTVSSTDIKGNTVIDKDTLMRSVTLKAPMVFRKNVLERDMRIISDQYYRLGYAMMVITPDMVPNDTDRTVSITLNISEGTQYYVGKIEVSGNTKTRDKVIRREVRLDEGEIFDSTKLRRSYERINNLDFFESVEMVPKPQVEKSTVDVEIKVKEKSTGFLSVGGGYSSADGFLGSVDLTQANLFGTGRYAKIKLEWGSTKTYYELGFRDPYFLDYPVSMSVGAYNTTKEYVDYDKEAWGGYISFGKSLSEYLYGTIGYQYEHAKVTNVDPTAPQVVRDQEGTSTTSAVSLNLTHDKRDNYMDPTRGTRNAIHMKLAGLGGSNGYFTGLLDSSWFFPVGPTTIAVRGRFGYSMEMFGKNLPLYERFYVGGISTVRGLDLGDAGPKDPVTDDPIGGTEELIFNLEYIFPISTEMRLKGVVFFDAGNAYLDFDDFPSLRYTTGLGVRWQSPFGPIRLEYGYNLEKKPGESSGKFEFAFGSAF